MASKRKKSDEDNQQGTTTRKRSSVQPALPNGERAVDNREYGKGYGSSREELRSNEAAGDAEGQGEGLPDPVEGAVVGRLGKVPENPPMPLYEANQIIEAAEGYWGLKPGSIRDDGRQFNVVWPRFIVCSILRRKGYSYSAIDVVINKKRGAARYAVNQFDAITSVYEKYREQVVQFDRYLWKKETANSREGYRSVAANR